MDPAWAAVVLGAATLLGSAGVLLARAVTRWAVEVGQLRLEIAAFGQEITAQRGEDRIEVRQLLGDALARHESTCPARDPSGVHTRGQ